MAGAMIWMITAMPAGLPAAPQAPARGAGHAMSGPAMPAMSHPAAPTAVLAVSILLAAYFGLAVIPCLVRAIGPGPRINDTAAASHAAMSAGMAAMLLAML